MQIRALIDRSGTTQIETISILEDLWHDYLFFKNHAEQFEGSTDRTSHLIAKRYWRASVLSLLSYFEGAVTRWLARLLEDAGYTKTQRSKQINTTLCEKVNLIRKLVPQALAAPNLDSVRKLRNMLVHLKPGNDLKIHDALDGALLVQAEQEIDLWFGAIESALNISRHPDSKARSKRLTDALGPTVPDSEGYTAPDWF